MRNPTDTRNVTPRPGSALWIYIGAVTIAGAVVLVVAAGQLKQLSWLVHHPVFWVVGALILSGEIWRIVTPGRSSPDSPAVSRTISVGVMLCWGFPIAVLLRAVAIVVVGLAQRNAPQRVAFNAAQLSLSLGAAQVVLWATGYSPARLHPWHPDNGHMVALLLAALAYFVVNFCLVNLVVSSISRTPIKAVVRANLAYQGISHLVLFGTAPLVAIVMQTGSPIMVALFAFPLAALYFSAAMSVQREHQANHDELTGLLNRKLLARRSGEALARAANSGSKAGFLLIDLDRATGLKQVNDTLGHAVGDRLLQVVAHRLAHSVRPGDVVARLGGDEFAVLLPSVREAASAREVASRLRAALAEPVRLEVMTFHVEASVGIAIFPDDADGFDQLMQRADVAMYLAKERRSGIERYQADADRNSAERLALLGDLRGAVHDRQIQLYYQPTVLLEGEQVIGMEALARWPHPRHGMLDAAEFIGLAEQSHLTSELTEHVLDQALCQAARWWRDGLAVPVTVNVPARDLVSFRLVELVSQLLGQYGLDPQALRLDVSEHVLAARPQHAPEAVKALTGLGVGVSLNDFGAGYSSLAQLTRLGISEVKLDPALVSGMPDNPDRRMTVESLVRLAQSLGIRSVGEGVETAAEAAVLRLIGCDAAQGWLYGRPLDAVAATDWLAEHWRARQPECRTAGTGDHGVGDHGDEPPRTAVAAGLKAF